tara:strand:+ start:368 stop:589 length:222 start_codon:yes stop_codon:yes gene_type:complete
MGMLDAGLILALLGISSWLGFLNYRILQITRDIHMLTISLDTATKSIHVLTEDMVSNLREVVANTSFELPRSG